MPRADATARPARWLGVVALAAMLAGYQAIETWRSGHAVLINMSDSLPNWAFLLTKGSAPAFGDHVFFEAPRSQLLAAHFGPRPAPFGKRVLGMPGEVVRHHHRLVTVGVRVVGWTKPVTRTGMPLARGPQGRIPPGCYYVGTDHPDGFDSRYAAIGFVCRRQILGVGTPVL